MTRTPRYFFYFFLICVYASENAHSGADPFLRKAVYTCITGQYDNLISHAYSSDQWDYICFTDNQELLANGHNLWRIYPLHFSCLDNARNSRWHKVFPDQILPEYDISLYVDANIDILTPDLFEYVDEELLSRPEETLAVHPHLFRNCIYQEARECIRLKLDDPVTILQHVSKLKKLKYPENNGLQENNIIYRRHHNNRVKRVMEEWWWWICNYSRRDQLSFNYVIWHQNFKIHHFKKQFARDLNYGILLNHVGEVK